MIYSTEAVVLKSNPYGEADLIVTYFTKDYGLINLFAKSPRKIKSRFGSSFEPLTYAKIAFVGNNEKLQKIIQSDIIHSFHSIRENYHVFMAVGEVLRFLLMILPRKEPHEELFSLFISSLEFIEKEKKTENALLSLKIKSLRILGYLPDFKHCGKCKDKLNGEFFYSDGFILCKKCISSHSKLILSQGAAKLLNDINGWQLKYLSRVKIAPQLFRELEEFIKKHIQSILSYN